MTSSPRLVSVIHAAEQLDTSPGQVYRLIAAGHFECVDIGTATKPKTRLYQTSIDAYIKRRTRSPRGPRRSEPD